MTADTSVNVKKRVDLLGAVKRAAKEFDSLPNSAKSALKLNIPSISWWECCGINYPVSVTRCTKCGMIVER